MNPSIQPAKQELSFPKLKCLIELAKESPRLIPAMLDLLKQHTLDICIKQESFNVISLSGNEYIVASLGVPIIKQGEKDSHSVVPHKIEDIVEYLSGEDRKLGLMIIYEDFKYIQIPKEFFNVKSETQSGSLCIFESDYCISQNARHELELFFINYPEVLTVHFAQRNYHDEKVPILLIKTPADYECCDRALLTVPLLILQQDGFDIEKIQVVFIDNELPSEIKQVYQKKG